MDKRIITIFAFLLLCSFLLAQSPSKYSGTSSALFLRTGLSARVSALGESFTAIADDENALFYNPAGLVNINHTAVGLNHTEWFEDIRMDNIVFGYNVDNNLGIGLSLAHMWMPEIKGKDNFGNPTEDISVSSSIINLGLAYRIQHSLFLGVGLKYFNDDLAGFSANGFAFDVGIFMHTQIPGLTFGASVQNIGGKIKYDSDKEKIPLTYRVGFAYKIPSTGLTLALDGIKNIDNDISFAAGVEYTLLKSFFVRVGNNFKQDQNFTPGYGLGINIEDKYLIDYTYSAFDNLGNTHRIGFTFHFGSSAKQHSGRSSSYNSTLLHKNKVPENISYKIKENRLIVNWGSMPGAVYNVYAKANSNDPLKRLNDQSINENFLEFKKPSNVSNKIYLAITAVINNVESAFSREVLIDVN